jgi:hypothetical protein
VSDAEVCSCGNRFDGDNLCMVSACQWEDIESEHPCGDFPAPCNCDDPETHNGQGDNVSLPVFPCPVGAPGGL